MRYCELHVGKDFLINPYSVDEVILFPTLGAEEAVVSQELADLIQSINAEEVPADERLPIMHIDIVPLRVRLYAFKVTFIRIGEVYAYT